MPLFFFIMIVNTLAVGYTHYGVAPDIMTIGFPLLVMIGYGVRGWTFLKAGHRPMSDADAAHLLRATSVIAPVSSAIIVFWALVIFRYGDAYAQGHVVFYLGITVISYTFCQMQLRPAALSMTAVTVIPFAIFFAATGRPVFIAIALTMLLVSAAMVYILLVSSRDFARMIAFQKQLAEKHAAEIAAQRDGLQQAKRFEIALNSMLHGLCMFDADDRLIVCNERYARMYSLPPALTLPGASWRDIVAHRMEKVAPVNLTRDDVLAQRRDADLRLGETIMTWKLRDGRTILIRHQPITEGGWVAIHEDVTEKCKEEERLSHMSRHDALTGLPNRVLLIERMEREAEGLRRNDELAVFCVDIGQFKQTNDALGHAVGDALLREIANRLASCVREPDAVARIGGAEVAILHGGAAETDELAKLAQQVLDALTKGYEIDSHQINICPTVGIARSPRDETAGAPLLRLADIALDRAKSEKRACYRFFEAAMDSELQSRRRLEADLRRALVEEAFDLHYQAIK